MRRPRRHQPLFAIDPIRFVERGQLEPMAMRDRICRTGFHTIAAKDAAIVVKVYNIDYNRCIFCGYCVEACPTDAITHGHGFELATFNETNRIYRKERLVAPRPAHLG